MKASIISIISLAVAVAALPPAEVAFKKSGPMSIAKAGDQCQEGKVYCCSPQEDNSEKGLLHLLTHFNLLGADASCSPVTFIGPVNVALLGTVDDNTGNVDCNHTLACCTGEDCHPLGH